MKGRHMKLSSAWILATLLLVIGARLARAQETGSPAQPVKLADLLTEAERVHPAIKAEAEMAESKRAHVSQAKARPDGREPGDLQETAPREGSLPWHSPARLRKTLGKKGGEIVIEAGGLQFRPRDGATLNWSLLDIQTFSLWPHMLLIKTYKNRAHHLPGMQRYRFELTQKVPPAVAAELSRLVERPSQNAVPNPALPSLRDIPAHHRTRTGGTNGMLRFREGGIDYVTSALGDSRSWRWADLQTLSGVSPYTLFVFGYRDTYTFNLKQPLSRTLLDRSADAIYSHSVETRGPNEPVDNERRIGYE
jgi:hypothetical protein